MLNNVYKYNIAQYHTNLWLMIEQRLVYLHNYPWTTKLDRGLLSGDSRMENQL